MEILERLKIIKENEPAAKDLELVQVIDDSIKTLLGVLEEFGYASMFHRVIE